MNIVVKLLISLCLISNLAFAIVGGDRVEEERFSSVLGMNTCSAVLVHPRLILTAAHCINSENLTKKNKKVYLGLKNILNREHVKNYEVEKVEIHPEYYAVEEKPDKYYDYKAKDFAFILLKNPLENVQIDEIHLGEIDTSESNNFSAVGFGGDSRRKLRRNQKSYKKSVELKFLDYKEERLRLFGEEKTKKTLFGKRKYKEGICSGDSGGGVYSENDYGKLVAINVAAPRKCKKQSFSIYEPIYPNLCWVQSQSNIFLGKTDCEPESLIAEVE